ncbi:MAG: hypothetical protein KC416_02580, partial [Myxococcales bacterium]|nr:hypothetical protein [Myxococcales bacterium]
MADQSSKDQLGRILLKHRSISQSDLDAFLAQQRSAPDRRLASIVAASGKVSRLDLLRALSEQHGMPGVDLDQIGFPLDNLKHIPEDIAQKHRILPMRVTEDRLFLAMADPGDRRILDEIEFVTGRQVVAYVALEGELEALIATVYRLADSGETEYRAPNAPKGDRAPIQSIQPISGSQPASPFPNSRAESAPS